MLFFPKHGDVSDGHILLGVVELDGEVLPLLVVDGDSPDLLACTVEDLEVVLLACGVVDQGADLELDLVVAVVGGFVPDVEVLVGQVEGTRGVLLNGEVQRLDTLVAGVLGRVGSELQTGAAEPELLLENRGVGDGDFDCGVGRAVEAARLSGGELKDLGPGEVVALDVVGVEESVGGVEDGGGPGKVCWDAAVEDEGALHIVGSCACDVGPGGGSRQGKGSC